MADEFYEEIKKFMKAQKRAEKFKRPKFKCPLCGGSAWWCRSEINNHLHSGCKKCGFRIIE